MPRGRRRSTDSSRRPRTAPPDGRDPRALRTLFDTFWDAGGWRAEPTTDPADLQHAVAAGFMFGHTPVWEHDDVLARARRLAGEVSPEHVGDAFLASLSTRRLDWRSALASYSVLRNVPEHSIDPDGLAVPGCRSCGLAARAEVRLDTFSFERHKWGGVRHTHLDYAVFDLERLRAAPAPPPSDEDRRVLREVLDGVRGHRTKSELIKALAGSLPSTVEERRVLVSILAVSGVFSPPGRPTYFADFVPRPSTWSRPARDRGDWDYPAVWWEPEHGVDDAAVRCWFP